MEQNSVIRDKNKGRALKITQYASTAPSINIKKYLRIAVAE